MERSGQHDGRARERDYARIEARIFLCTDGGECVGSPEALRCDAYIAHRDDDTRYSLEIRARRLASEKHTSLARGDVLNQERKECAARL